MSLIAPLQQFAFTTTFFTHSLSIKMIQASLFIQLMHSMICPHKKFHGVSFTSSSKSGFKDPLKPAQTPSFSQQSLHRPQCRVQCSAAIRSSLGLTLNHQSDLLHIETIGLGPRDLNLQLYSLNTQPPSDLDLHSISTVDFVITFIMTRPIEPSDGSDISNGPQNP